MIDFRIEPELQAKLHWMATFVRAECEPMHMLFPGHGAPYDVANAEARAHLKTLQDRVKAPGLWACHLGAELAGPGYGQLTLAMMNEILRSEERRVGTACLRKCRSWWSTDHKKKK